MTEQPPPATTRPEYRLLLDTRRAYTDVIPHLRQAVEVTVRTCYAHPSSLLSNPPLLSSPSLPNLTRTSSGSLSTTWWRCCGTCYSRTSCTTLSSVVRNQMLRTPPGKSRTLLLCGSFTKLASFSGRVRRPGLWVHQTLSGKLSAQARKRTPGFAITTTFVRLLVPSSVPSLPVWGLRIRLRTEILRW